MSKPQSQHPAVRAWLYGTAKQQQDDDRPGGGAPAPPRNDDRPPLEKGPEGVELNGR
jgi:hypothetical protein